MGRVYATVEDEAIEEIDRKAEERGTSRSQVVTDATLEWLDRQKFPRIVEMKPIELDRMLEELEVARAELLRLRSVEHELDHTQERLREAHGAKAELEIKENALLECSEKAATMERERDRSLAQLQDCTARGEEKERLIQNQTDRIRWLEGQVALLHDKIIPKLPPPKPPLRQRISEAFWGRPKE